MIDILNLKNGMEDNLLLIQQINLMKQKEGEEQKGLVDDVIHAAQQHIDSINTVYLQGVSWLKGETEFALSFIQGRYYKLMKSKSWILDILVALIVFAFGSIKKKYKLGLF